MHVARTVGRNVVPYHVKVLTHSPIESLIRSLEVNDRDIHPVLRNDFRITNALRFHRVGAVFHEKSKWISRRRLHLTHRVPASLHENGLPRLCGVTQSADERNIEWRKPKRPAFD